MFSLLQSRRIRGAAGEPLPTVFKALDAKGTRLLRGQLGLVAAGPGTGKSAFALTLALKSGVTCLYFSADSDAFVQLTRSISILRGIPLEQAARMVLSEDLSAVETDLVDVPVRFNYTASPSLDDIERSMQSYEEVYGSYPGFVVVDNITNVRTDGSDDDPFSGLEALMDYLNDMARETQAFVMGLHHVTGPFNDSDKPIPLSGVKGQIARVPGLVLTLHKEPGEFGIADTLCVSTVKNRGGKADPSGYDFARLEFVGERMSIADFSNPPIREDQYQNVQH